MPALTRIIQRNAPGVYVSEDTYGAIPEALATHDAVYVVGTCTSSTFPTNTPVYISNYDDFINQVTSSPSAAAVKLFFDQRSGSGLYFTRVQPRQQATIAVTTFTPGTVLTVTVNGTSSVSYTCVTGDTAVTAVNALGARVAQNYVGVVSYYRSGSTSFLRYPAGVTVTVGTGITLGTPATAPTPAPYDVSDAIRYSFTPEHPQGYLCAPEFFQAYTTQADRTTLALEMEAFVSDPRYYWVAVVDPSQSVGTTQLLAVNNAIAEESNYISTRGNSWYYFPYLLNTANTAVPPSLAAIGVALRRARTDSFLQPPAGTTYPIYGISGVAVSVSADMQEQLNPRGINCIRRLPGKGTVVYGARTMSTNPFYRWAATRVLLNVLAGTLRRAYQDTVFTLVDGQGALFARIRQTASNICETLRLAGGIYGATPDQAYLVVCDNTNNTPSNLENGAVALDLVVIPSATAEAIDIRLSRAAIGTVLAEVVSSGDATGVSPTAT